jgi:GNAT superfamily N-acetyltransferase
MKPVRSIRQATPNDATVLAEIQVHAWQKAYRGQIPCDHLDGLDVAVAARRWRQNIADGSRAVFVVEASAVPVAWGSFAVARDKDLPTNAGEITALYVHPEHWRCDHGRCLMELAVAHARAQGWQWLALWVLRTNRVAREFYAAVGFAPDDSVRTEHLPIPVEEVRFIQSLGVA